MIRTSKYSPIASTMGEVNDFMRVGDDDIVAQYWYRRVSYEHQIEIIDEIKGRMSPLLRAAHERFGTRLTIFRHWFEETTGHYSVESLEDWNEVSKALPATMFEEFAILLAWKFNVPMPIDG
jgi:hypothetical protein